MADAKIDSVMKDFPPVKGLASSPGKYNEGSGLGPKGVDGGIPLKIIDTSINTNNSMPIATTMTSTAPKATSDKSAGGTKPIDTTMRGPKG